MKNILSICKVKWSNMSNPLEFISSLNPMQIVKPAIPINVFKVGYAYTTSRGNKKDGTKYFLINSVNPQQNCEALLSKWVTDYNTKNNHRQLSNVKFLDSSLIMSLEL